MVVFFSVLGARHQKQLGNSHFRPDVMILSCQDSVAQLAMLYTEYRRPLLRQHGLDLLIQEKQRIHRQDKNCLQQQC